MFVIRVAGHHHKTAISSFKAFTLVELLVVLAVVAILAFLGFSAVSATLRNAKKVQCISKMRGLGGAFLLYANDHEGELPRSMHSAGSKGEDSWTYAIAPYLGISTPLSSDSWPPLFEKYYRCPADTNRSSARWSYGLNVFFELDPDGDDYAGSPATWRRVQNVSFRQKTILLAEPRGTDFGDHVMSHLWGNAKAAQNALDFKRHGTAANYTFLDGHVETLGVESVFTNGINYFNPSLAK
jgi:prepilin-type N-terminal cleavage/methylation domain-containing protein/prepilin-type processing-associated H-X9-DG protein